MPYPNRVFTTPTITNFKKVISKNFARNFFTYFLLKTELTSTLYTNYPKFAIALLLIKFVYLIEKFVEPCYNTLINCQGEFKMARFDSLDAYKNKIKKVLITEEEIQEAVVKTAKIIDDIYDGTPILLVSILKGAFVYMADVCKRVTVPCEVAFMTAQSYFNDTVSSGKVEITMDIKQKLEDYHVVIIEDIVDTGRTLSEIVKILKTRNPKSFRVITLLDKPSRRSVEFKADVSMFTIPDHFVIGYGLDCGENFRNLPYVAEYNND